MIYLMRYRESGRIGREELAVLNYAIYEGLPYKYVNEEDVQGLRGLTKDDLFVGSVEAFEILFGKLPEPNYYPASLHQYLNRTVWRGNLSELKQSLSNGKPLFAKPANRWKAFTGRLFKSLAELDGMHDFEAVDSLLLAEPIEFTYEYRAYITNGVILSVDQYTGEEDVAPDMSIIEDAVRLYAEEEGALITYAMDWGYTSTGEFCLVEVNHGFSIGKYSSISNKDYYQFLMRGYLALYLSLDGNDVQAPVIRVDDTFNAQ